jgi:hypothetical protein
LEFDFAGLLLDKNEIMAGQQKRSQPNKWLTPYFLSGKMVPRDRIELPTQGFSVPSRTSDIIILLTLKTGICYFIEWNGSWLKSELAWGE